MSWQKIEERNTLEKFQELIFFGPSKNNSTKIEFPPSWKKEAQQTYSHFLSFLEKKHSIYGVTTGFGESCTRDVATHQSEELQRNLILYLSCGTGKLLQKPVRRATVLFRLLSLARGLSGVSWELIEEIQFLVESDWLPLIPREGSLGASGDLIPLSYLAAVIQGQGEVETQEGVLPSEKAYAQIGRKPYHLKPKEGLAIVNGTSVMAAQSFVNLIEIESLIQLSILESAWLCIAVLGHTEPFDAFIHATAKSAPGQKQVAEKVFSILEKEKYFGPHSFPSSSVFPNLKQRISIQDRYSLRCVPQILGPIVDTLSLVRSWLEEEINSVSDNPLIDSSLPRLVSGGNFYGGYLSQGMDYLKISLAHMADLLDRQVTLLFDERGNRGLPPNLTDWKTLPEEERFLHHGLKGLHQSVSAITSELIQHSIPSGIFSRSSESHNQDKVSLGLSAAKSCEQMIDISFRLHAAFLVCLLQAIDFRSFSFTSNSCQFLYQKVRQIIPFIQRDQALDKKIQLLSETLRELVWRKGGILGEKIG